MSIYFVKTGRLIGQLSDKGIVRKDIFCVWKKVEKDKSDENELVYCLTPTCILSFNPITGNVVSSINHPEFIKLPPPNDNVLSVHVTFKSPELSNQPDRIYCVVKEDSKNINNEELKPKDKASAKKKLRKHDCILTGYTTHKKKTYKFGQVNTELKKALYSANSSLVVKVALAVVGNKGSKLTFFTPEGLVVDSHAVPKDRPITCVSIHPVELTVACGDKSGKIFVWRNTHDDPNRFVSTQMHWHSLPVRALEWSNNVFSDSRHIYSGGEEGAILKWDSRSATRVGIVPRLGCTIAHISASSGTVVTVNSNNSLKIFTSTFEEVASIVGLADRNIKFSTSRRKGKLKNTNLDTFFNIASNLHPNTTLWKLNYLKEKARTKLFFHQGLQATVLLNELKNEIQLFDPIIKTEKLALDVSSFNKVLGDRPSKDEGFDEDNSDKSTPITLFSSSKCGKWLVTVESNWDTLGGQCIKIWNFDCNSRSKGEEKFKLNTQINEDGCCQIVSLDFLSLPSYSSKTDVINGLIACGTDKKAKLWRLSNDYHELDMANPSKWEAVRIFTYLNLEPLCSAGSPDKSVLAIAFGSRLTLWDSETFSLLTCLTSKSDNSEYTSVLFGYGSKSSHLLLGSTETHILVWDLLSSHLIKKMPLDRPTLVQLGNSIGILHSRGALLLDSVLNISVISNLENISGIANDEKSGKTYLLHSTPTCNNLLSFVKTETSHEPISDEPEKNTASDNKFELLLNQKVNQVNIEQSATYAQARTNINLLSHDLITLSVSECSESIVKLAMPI